MLNNEQINEIKEHLEKAQNPVFYYDNDADGLCSFLLLRRFLGRGKGVAVRSYPDLNASYVRKVDELKGDYVFVLDKPNLSEEFVLEITEKGIPIVWIDHHDISGLESLEQKEMLHIYNPARNKEKSYEPVSYLCYKITQRKEDAWIAIMGCISDHFLPDFLDDFAEEKPELWGKKIKKPFDALYGTEIGKISLALNFGLMDSTTHIVQLQNYLVNCRNPEEVLSETKENKAFRDKYEEIKKKYKSLVEKARENVSGKLIYFEYGGELSISSEVSNELYFEFPEKYIIVAYKKGGISNLSLRGNKIRNILEKVLKNFEGATGGGHEDAVGARIKVEDL